LPGFGVEIKSLVNDLMQFGYNDSSTIPSQYLV